jgi:hypothetical protein
MPLTKVQAEIGRLLARNRSEDSYLAGGAAILLDPVTKRFSQDLDYFHDSAARVASAFKADQETLTTNGFLVEIQISQPGYLRALVRRDLDATKVEWAQDSTWRFMPVIHSEEIGYLLHPIDLATNKILALAGRDELRDLLDTLHLHRHVLALGPLVWAAAGKDPGFSPISLLELLHRRGKIQAEDLNRLHTTEVMNPQLLKQEWTVTLESADVFVRSRPPQEVGCLFYSSKLQSFVDPSLHEPSDIIHHYGRPGGVLPRITE